MPMEQYNETDTRERLITPALDKRGWTEDMIRREETAGAILKDKGDAYRSDRKRVDYVLRVAVAGGTQPVPVALIEAKKNTASPGAGLEQVKDYMRRTHVPFVYSTNGYRFVEYDCGTGMTSEARDMADFPSPDELRRRYEDYAGFCLDEECAKPLITPYSGGEGGRRYYQDAAIRAALEKIAKAEKAGEPARVLMSLATGAGKTFIAVQLLKRLDIAGKVTNALFLCDRDILRGQALLAFRAAFDNNAEAVRSDASGGNIAANARVHIATYQTLGIADDSGEGDKSFAAKHYPDNYFSHIIIDECHRSAWSKWSEILRRNPKAAQIGLTATPRKIGGNDEDNDISANNFQYFGEPVYSYALPRGADDGYLARCDVHTAKINLDDTGVSIDELMKRNPVHYRTGEALTREQLKEMYEKRQFEAMLVLPDRIKMMCVHLFDKLTENGGDPRQKTIIFCASNIHAQLVAAQMNNLYAGWRGKNNEPKADPYAFRCTAESDGNKEVPAFRRNSRHHFVAATVDLLSTGVDIPCVRHIAFFRYLNSPIALHQMIGRGARIDEPSEKFGFTVHDYTDAMRLADKDDLRPPNTGGGKRHKKPANIPVITVAEGFVVSIADTGDYIIVESPDGKIARLSAEQYRAQMVGRLLEKVETIGDLRRIWTDPDRRKGLLKYLANEKCPPALLRGLPDMEKFDDFDILAEAAYGALRRTREDRAEAFRYKNADWLKDLPESAANTLCAFVSLFARGGIEQLETPLAFRTELVRSAGGRDALEIPGKDPYELMRETKRRLFAA